MPYLDYSSTNREKILYNVEEDECNRICSLDDNCNGYSYDTIQKSCTLKNDLETPFLNKNTKHPFFTSYNNSYAEYNEKLNNGTSLITLGDTTNKIDDFNCEKLCSISDECKGFNYDIKNKNCNLLSKIDENLPNENYKYYEKNLI